MSTESDKINTGALATITAVGTFAMVAVAAVVTALVRYDVGAAEGAKYADGNQSYRELVAEQSTKLASSPHWLDKQKGVVALPIDRAMQLVAKELARDPNRATPRATGAAADPRTNAGGAPGEPAGAAGGPPLQVVPGISGPGSNTPVNRPGESPKLEHTRAAGGSAGTAAPPNSPAVAGKPQR
jgi:hypothetical protein